MSSVEDAITVAETLKPVRVLGQSVSDGREREIFPHLFVGGNTNADVLADGPVHAKMAEARLQSAARIELKTPSRLSAGEEFPIDILIHNVAAGHNLPTGVTELRQMWVELELVDATGQVVFRHGGLDAEQEITDDTIRFGALAGDESGKPTYKPWEMTRFLWKRTIPPKDHSQDQVLVKLPSGISGDLTIQARLRYRSVAPHIAKEILPDGSFSPKIVEMCQKSVRITVP